MGKRKPKKDRNLGLSADTIFRKRALRQSAGLWFGVALVFFAATIAVIQAGPFGLDLAVGTSASGTDSAVLEFSYALLGGFGLAWLLLAIVPAVFYYRFAIKRGLPSLRGNAVTAIPAASG